MEISLVETPNLSDNRLDDNSTVTCPICGKKFVVITNTHLLTHNLSIKEFKEIHPDTPLWSADRTNKLVERMKKYNHLIKPSVRRRAIKTRHERYGPSWCKNPDSMRGNNNPAKHPEVREKIRISKLGVPRPDMVQNNPFHRPEVRKKWFIVMKGDKNPAKRPEIRKKISSIIKALWRDPFSTYNTKSYRVKLSTSNHNKKFGTNESSKHKTFKSLIGQTLLTLDYEVDYEKWITINKNHYRIDIVATHDNERMAVEIGKCCDNKLRDLEILFDSVIHLPYNILDRVEKWM